MAGQAASGTVALPLVIQGLGWLAKLCFASHSFGPYRAGQPARQLRPLQSTDVSDGFFHEGQKVWVMLPNGGRRPAVFVGDGDNATFFGGPPLVYVVLTDTRQGAEIEISHVVPR